MAAFLDRSRRGGGSVPAAVRIIIFGPGDAKTDWPVATAAVDPNRNRIVTLTRSW
jgi:hypothetical protein